MRTYTAEDFDHRRDELKHEPRPTDPPHRLDRPITTAQDIALCVRGMANLDEAAKLIDQYAAMVAAGARVEEGELVRTRIFAALKSSLSRKEPSDAQT